MIDARSSLMFQRFCAEVMQYDAARRPDASGFVWFAYIEPGVSTATYMHYALNGRPFFSPLGDMPKSASILLCDIPDDVDPDKADHSAVVATYRAEDGRWACGVAFEDDATEWDFDPGNIRDLAEKVSPL